MSTLALTSPPNRILTSVDMCRNALPPRVGLLCAALRGAVPQHQGGDDDSCPAEDVRNVSRGKLLLPIRGRGTGNSPETRGGAGGWVDTRVVGYRDRLLWTNTKEVHSWQCTLLLTAM